MLETNTVTNAVINENVGAILAASEDAMIAAEATLPEEVKKELNSFANDTTVTATGRHHALSLFGVVELHRSIQKGARLLVEGHDGQRTVPIIDRQEVRLIAIQREVARRGPAGVDAESAPRGHLGRATPATCLLASGGAGHLEGRRTRSHGQDTPPPRVTPRETRQVGLRGR